MLGQGSREDCHSNRAAAAERLVPLPDAKQPFESFNRFLEEEEEVEAEVSLLACVPVSAGLASGTKPTI